jgi:hypothetical protein
MLPIGKSCRFRDFQAFPASGSPDADKDTHGKIGLSHPSTLVYGSDFDQRHNVHRTALPSSEAILRGYKYIAVL